MEKTDKNTKKEPQRFDKAFLETYCKEHGIELENIYENVNSKTTIVGKCIEPDCCEKFSKTFTSLVNYNAYCIKHSKNKRLEQYKQTCLQKYGVENVFQNTYCKDKIKKTLISKYGVENPMYIEKFKTKIKQTNLDRYGVENTFQSEKLKEKIRQTCFEKYGVQHALQKQEFKNKLKRTNLEKYGVENVFQNNEIKQKLRQTCFEKYGVEYPNQNIDIMEKSSKNSYKLKEYTMPSGTVLQYQGFEHFAIDELLQADIEEEDIITGCNNMPEIWYEDTNGKKRKHYVDIFIPSQNKCIEVKSTWTAKKKADCIFLKQAAAKELGYNYEIWVYNGKGEKVECYV